MPPLCSAVISYLCFLGSHKAHDQVQSCTPSSSKIMLHWQTSLLALLLLIPISLKYVVTGQLEEWCVADVQTPDDELQRALNWACGKGGADCTKIQPSQPCYMPNTIKDHASYAFNSYYQKYKHKGGSCYFNSAAMVTGLDPSHGGCKYEYIP